MDVFGDKDGAVHFDAAAQGAEALAWIVDVPPWSNVWPKPCATSPRWKWCKPRERCPDGGVRRARQQHPGRVRRGFRSHPLHPSTPSPPGWNVNTRTARWPGSGFARWHPRLLAAGWPRGSVGGRGLVGRPRAVAPLLALEPEAFAEQLETASQGCAGAAGTHLRPLFVAAAAGAGVPLVRPAAQPWQNPAQLGAGGRRAHNIHPRQARA